MKKQLIQKPISVLLTFFILTTFLSIFSFVIPSYAAQRKETYNGSNLDNGRYPGYANLLNSLRQAHPNWTFTLLYTGLDWNDVLNNEYTGHYDRPRNLIPFSKGAGWRCTICGDELYDNGEWCCASRNAIAYQIDPRNSLNNNDIFQFEDARFVEGAQTIAGIMSKTNNTFLKGESVANALLTAGRNANINPYFIASRLIQEQGTGGTTLSKGYSYNGKTVYNPFNIGASGNGTSEIIQNGANYAYEKEWFSLEAGILGGINFINEKYMNKGQVSAFLQKFDVVGESSQDLYTNQYMQSLQAAQFEGVSTRKQYEVSKTKESYLNFVIPLFENMPTNSSPRPSDSATSMITTINMKTNCTVNMRSTPNATTTSNKIGSIANGTTVLAIEEGIPGQKLVNGQAVDTTFNKIVLDNGTYGYIVASALDQVADVVTCNEALVINTLTQLRNGPGTEHTTVITTLSEGQAVTRIDLSRYTLNGITWDRVVLPNGQQGFVNTTALSKNITPEPEPNPDVPVGGTKFKIESDKIIAEPGMLLKDIKNAGYTVTSAVKDGKEIGDEDFIGTGVMINTDKGMYTLVKLGDVNGDGKIKTADYMYLKNVIMGTETLTEIQKIAADVKKDGEIKSSDYMKIKNVIMGTEEITLE